MSCVGIFFALHPFFSPFCSVHLNVLCDYCFYGIFIHLSIYLSFIWCFTPAQEYFTYTMLARIIVSGNQALPYGIHKAALLYVWGLRNVCDRLDSCAIYGKVSCYTDIYPLTGSSQLGEPWASKSSSDLVCKSNNLDCSPHGHELILATPGKAVANNLPWKLLSTVSQNEINKPKIFKYVHMRLNINQLTTRSYWVALFISLTGLSHSTQYISRIRWRAAY